MYDEGLINLIQVALDIGASNATYGRIDAKKLVPSPTTCSKTLTDEATKARQETAKRVAVAVKEFRCAATCDSCTEDHNKAKFLAFTTHYVDGWEMKDQLLFVAPLEPGEAATSENILKVIKTNFEELGIDPDLLPRVKFVTDAGSDIKKALEEYDWHYCMAHALNVVLRTSMSVKYATVVQNMVESCPTARRAVEKANKWVRDARKALPQKHPLLSKLKCSNLQSQGHIPPLNCAVMYRTQVFFFFFVILAPGQTRVPC